MAYTQAGWPQHALLRRESHCQLGVGSPPIRESGGQVVADTTSTALTGAEAVSNQTQWNVEVAAMLAAVDWARERELDRTPLRLQDLADHYAAKKNLPQVMVRSTARELIKDRLGVCIRFEFESSPPSISGVGE